MTPDPPDDDKCQIALCNQTHFTYCPHCKLFVCIEHLNEHYANYRQEYQLLLNNAKQQEMVNKQFMNEIDNEKNQLVQFFERQIQYYQWDEKYFADKTMQLTIRPQDCADLRSRLLQSSERRSKLKTVLQQLHQFIDEYNYQQSHERIEEPMDSLPTIKSEETLQKPRISKSSPLAQFSIDYEEIDDDDEYANHAQAGASATDAHETILNGHRSSNSIQEKSDKSNNSSSKTIILKKNGKQQASTAKRKESASELSQSMDELDEDETDNDHPASDPDFAGAPRTPRPSGRRRGDSATARPIVNHFQVNTCPLADKSYGINLSQHPLRFVPCGRPNIASISLFTHLRVFHCLSSKASLRLVRHIMYNGCERDCDLFSQSIESLVSILPKSYRGRCPLTRLGAFGLNRFHDIRLCSEDQTHEDTGLLNHFVVYHCLSYPWANKLCNAMQAGDYDGSKQILFKPNEPIKAEKWLTSQGKLILAKRLSSARKHRRRIVNGKRKK